MARKHWWTMVKSFIVIVALLIACLSNSTLTFAADRVRFAYPAKSLNYLPITMGRDKGMFQAEGIDLQMVLVASTIQVTALTTGDIDFSGAQSQVMAGAARGSSRQSLCARRTVQSCDLGGA